MSYFSISNSTAFAGTAQVNLGATYTTQICVAASSGGIAAAPTYTGLRRGWVNDLLMGTNAAPADNYLEYELIRCTVGSTVVWLGSVSSVSSGYIDPSYGDAGCISSLLLINSSAETNVAAAGNQPFYVGVNQRASYRWVSGPGQEIHWPANTSGTGLNGLAFKARSGAYTNTVACTLKGLEM